MPNPFPYPLVPSTTIVGSPAAAAETTIGQVVVPGGAGPTTRALLIAFAAFTVGATGTAVRLRLRNGSLTGAVVGDTGAMTGGVAAAGLVSYGLLGFDTPGDVASLLYVLTLQVTGGSGASTVSGVQVGGFLFG